MTDRISVLWLCGPPGVGKTVVGWAIYTDLVAPGVAAGYVDIDHLGMCYPEMPSDPGRYRLQARNLGAVIDGYQEAGARCVVVSGVVDARLGVHVDEIPQAAVTVCQLCADKGDLARRLLGRIGGADASVQGSPESADLDAGAIAGICVDPGARRSTMAELGADPGVRRVVHRPQRHRGWIALTRDVDRPLATV